MQYGEERKRKAELKQKRRSSLKRAIIDFRSDRDIGSCGCTISTEEEPFGIEIGVNIGSCSDGRELIEEDKIGVVVQEIESDVSKAREVVSAACGDMNEEEEEEEEEGEDFFIDSFLMGSPPSLSSPEQSLKWEILDDPDGILEHNTGAPCGTYSSDWESTFIRELELYLNLNLIMRRTSANKS